jgi:Arc/MetJ family transcription regulator
LCFTVEVEMRTTLAIDDALIAEAEALVGAMSKSALVHEALVALVQRESAKRLALLGGSDPDLTATPRRKSSAA